MTTPTPSTPAHAGSSEPAASRELASPRLLAAWALLGYVALFLLFRFIQWILPGDDAFRTFSFRSATAGFRQLEVMVMPVIAVLLAVHVAPALRSARLLSAIALIEYAVALFFGTVTLLVGLGRVFDDARDTSDAFNALEYLLLGLGDLALMAVAGYVAFQAFRNMGGRIQFGRSGAARSGTGASPYVGG